MADMFGAVEGFRAYDADQAKLAEIASMNALRAEQGSHQQSLSRLNDAQAQVMLRKNDQEEQKLALLASGGRVSGGGMAGSDSAGDGYVTQEQRPPSFTELTEGLRGKAGQLAAAGYIEDAAKLTNELAGIQQKVSAAGNSAAAQRSHALGDEIKRLRLVQEALSGVNSPQALAQARLALSANPLTADAIDPRSNPGMAALLQQYNPVGIAAYLTGSPAAIKKRELQLKEIDEGRKQEDSASRRSVDGVRKEVMQRRVAVSEEREARIAKAGGNVGGEGLVTTGEVTAMKDLLKAGGFNADGDDAKVQARTLAEEARRLQRSNRGLSLTEARTRVIEESNARGELVKPGFGRDNKFKPQGGSLSQPHDLPKSVDKLTAGSYYRAPDGSIAKFTGKGWEKISAPMRIPQTSVGSTLAEDDDEEE